MLAMTTVASSRQRFRQHMGFTALHVGYVGLIAWLFRGLDVTYFVMISVALLVSGAIVLRAPGYLRRPLAARLHAVPDAAVSAG
jgi:hypothetical protein